MSKFVVKQRDIMLLRAGGYVNVKINKQSAKGAI
jgi:hypothetical protein